MFDDKPDTADGPSPTGEVTTDERPQSVGHEVVGVVVVDVMVVVVVVVVEGMAVSRIKPGFGFFRVATFKLHHEEAGNMKTMHG